MRILITGSTGFIGNELSNQLIKYGHELYEIVRDPLPRHLHIPARNRTTVIHGDIRDAQVVERAFLKARPDVTIHLAAQALVGDGVVSPSETYTTNVIGTMNMLESFMKVCASKRFVFASSDKAYGEGRGRVYKESDQMDGRGIYDSSKSCADLMARSYAETYRLDIRCARLGNVYGPSDTEMSRVVPSIVRDITTNLRLPQLRSSGRAVRDYLYIDDAVEAYVNLTTAPQSGLYQAYNFSGGRPISVLELACLAVDVAREEPIIRPKLWKNGGYEALCELFPRKKLPYDPNDDVEFVGGRNDEIEYQELDNSKAQKYFGWKPKIDLRTGLTRTIDAAWNGRPYFAVLSP